MEDKKLQQLKDHLCDLGYEDAVVFDDPDYVDAYVGISHDGRVIYSYDRMIDCLIAEDGMTFDEAVEFIDYNTIRAIPYAGDRAPIVLYDDQDMVWDDYGPQEEKDEPIKCPRYNEGYGCEISPLKSCDSCKDNPNKSEC